MEATERLPRAGWREEETEQLRREVTRAGDEGLPLRAVFEKMGEALGRKPNSVRNYYYMRLRAGDLNCERRAAPFQTFTEQEVRDLIREVQKGRAAGESVRACVTQLAGGDRALMLRYQNKYRSVIKKHPEWIAEASGALDMEAARLPDGDALVSAARERARMLRDPDVRALYEGLERLVSRAALAQTADGDETARRDRLRVEHDLLLLRTEDLQRAAGELVLACKELLALPEPERFLHLNDHCEALARCVSGVENAFV